MVTGVQVQPSLIIFSCELDVSGHMGLTQWLGDPGLSCCVIFLASYFGLTAFHRLSL